MLRPVSSDKVSSTIGLRPAPMICNTVGILAVLISVPTVTSAGTVSSSVSDTILNRALGAQHAIQQGQAGGIGDRRQVQGSR